MYSIIIIHTLLNNIEKNESSVPMAPPLPYGDNNYKLQGPINESTSILRKSYGWTKGCMGGGDPVKTY